MLDRLVSPLTFAAALGSGVIAGALFSYSDFTMRALRRLPPAQGIRAMQTVNVAVPNSLFGATFVGTGVVSLALAGLALTRWEKPDAAWNLTGGLLYLIGVIGVSAAANIPRNDALAKVLPEAESAAGQWQTFLAGWIPWNHVRTVASGAALLAFIMALRAANAE